MNYTPVLLVADSLGWIGVLIAYVLVLSILMYFLSIRPNRNKQKHIQAMLSNLEAGDSVLTTSGFYGVSIDVRDEIVIVEFGSDRHCRIPMQKDAIVSVEKANEGND